METIFQEVGRDDSTALALMAMLIVWALVREVLPMLLKGRRAEPHCQGVTRPELATLEVKVDSLHHRFDHIDAALNAQSAKRGAGE